MMKEIYRQKLAAPLEVEKLHLAVPATYGDRYDYLGQIPVASPAQISVAAEAISLKATANPGQQDLVVRTNKPELFTVNQGEDGLHLQQKDLDVHKLHAKKPGARSLIGRLISGNVIGMDNVDGVKVEIEAPSGANLRLVAAAAQVKASGAWNLNSYEIAAGDVKIQNLVSAQMQLDAGNISIGSCVEANLRAAAGNIKLGSFLTKAQLQVDTGNLKIERAVQGKVYAKTSMGNVRIGIVDGAALTADLKTNFGSVNSDFEPAGTAHGFFSGKTEAVANPDIEVFAHTSMGKVRLEKLPA